LIFTRNLMHRPLQPHFTPKHNFAFPDLTPAGGLFIL
jgi:hypothetical protein